MHCAPWSSAHARLVVGCNLGGAVVVVVSARAASDAALRDQVGWLNLSVLAALLAVVANGSLFLVARRAIGRRRLALVPNVRTGGAERTSSPAGGWYWVPGTIRAHRLGCPMTEGRTPRHVSDAVIRSEHLRRCELCG